MKFPSLKKINLTIVASPIGNINEVSYQTINSLKKADIVVCENILKTKKIFFKYELNMDKKFLKCNQSTEELAFFAIRNYLEKFKKKEAVEVSLISNAGYPLISDPGWYFIKKLKENYNTNIFVSNGPCSINHALVVSGFRIDSYFFFGFLPKKNSEFQKQIIKVKTISTLIVFFLSKHRLKKELEKLASFFSDKQASLSFELSKINEKVINGKLNDLLKMIDSPKGEIILIINNN